MLMCKELKSKEIKKNRKAISVKVTPTKRTNMKHNKGKYKGFMCPRRSALDYSFAKVLLLHAEKGCNANCREN